MYGSKLISPWLYFGGFGNSTGFRNAPNYEITDKYNTLKDTIAPRLSGLMGKTLRKLKAVNQFAGSRGIDALVDPQEAIPPYDYIDYIHAYGGPNDTCFVELGIFEDPQDTYVKYFMPLNRYYSDKYNLNFGLKNLVGYKNWKVFDFADTTHFTMITNYNTALFADAIYPGDANLYSISPVVMYGGELEYNDTIKTGTVTLNSDMTIENGVNLIINSHYIAKDTITLNGTGFIKGDGYFYLQDDGAIIINDWDRSFSRAEMVIIRN
jgi:hypothetical protein